MHVEDSPLINQPVQKVFNYVADTRTLPQWSGPAVEVRDIQQDTLGELGEGDEFTAIHKFLGQRVEEHVEVTAYEPNRHVRHWSTGGPMPIEVNYIFEEVPGAGTRLTVSLDTQPEGFFKLIGPVFRSAVKRTVRNDLQTLKDVLEAQAERGEENTSESHPTEGNREYFRNLIEKTKERSGL
jgi:uncharacterized membrane protein